MIMNEDYYWYLLSLAKGIGPKKMHKIYDYLSAEGMEISDIFDMSDEEKKSQLNFNDKICESLYEVDDSKTYDIYQRLKHQKVHLVHIGSTYYPNRLTQILEKDAPPFLFCGGALSLFKAKGVSIVGARDISDEGTLITRSIAKELTLSGFNIISGYAKGVDSNAHLGALENEGTTTIILSYGILHFKQKREFIDFNWSGSILVVSQFNPNTEWKSYNAMKRNAIVVALSEKIIVIKAGAERDKNGKMSGTFNTGRTALELNIPLFVLSPSLVQDSIGNKILIERGGIEITPDNLLDKINEVNTSSENDDYDKSTQEEIF